MCSFLGRRLGQRGQEKEDSHLSFSNKDSCASLHEGSLSGHCRQGRTGSSDGNPRTSNPGKFSTQHMGPGRGPGDGRVQPCQAFGAGYTSAWAGAWARGDVAESWWAEWWVLCRLWPCRRPSFPRAQGFVCRKWPCRTRPGPARSEDGWPGGVTHGCRGGASTLIWTLTTSDVPVCLLLP